MDELGVGDLIKGVIVERGGSALLQFIARKVGLQKEPLQAKIHEAAGRQIKNIEIIEDVYSDLFDIVRMDGPVGGVGTLKNQGVDEVQRKKNALKELAKRVVDLLRLSGPTLTVAQITNRTHMGTDGSAKRAFLKAFTAHEARSPSHFYELFNGEFWTYKKSGLGTGGTVTLLKLHR